MEKLVLVGKYFWVVSRGGPTTDAFIIHNEYSPNKELYAIKGVVHIIE